MAVTTLLVGLSKLSVFVQHQSTATVSLLDSSHQLIQCRRVLDKLIVTQLVKKFFDFGEAEGSLSYLQELSAGPCSEPHDFSPQFPPYLPKIRYSINLTSTHSSSEWSLSFLCSDNFSSLLHCVPHASSVWDNRYSTWLPHDWEPK
jgi:hypothetical protein